MKRILMTLIPAALLLLVPLLLLAGCAGTEPSDTPTEAPTDTRPGEPSATEASGTDTATDVPTDAPTEADPGTPTEPATDPASPDTEPETVPDTEPETLPDTEPESLSLAGYWAGDDIIVTPTTAAEHPLGSLTICGHDVKDGDLAILYSNEPDDRERSAADLIGDWIMKATGVELPVRSAKHADEYAFALVVGQTSLDTPAVEERRARLTGQGYLLFAEGNRLFLSGSTPNGTWNGAICFLEDYVGARFFTADCEVVLPADARAVPTDADTVYSPAHDFRCEYYRFTDSEYDRMHKLNPVKYAVGMRVHTLFYLAEQTGTAQNNQPCMTDETVYQTVLGHVREWLADNPNIPAVSVTQNDSENERQLGCQCENCKALNQKYGTEGGALFAFVNRIAADIKDDYPNVMVETLAYQYSIQPPKDFVFEDNVLIQLCLIDTCFAHALDDPKCSINKHYFDTLVAWSQVCDHISIWDYHTNFNFYPSFFPNEKILYDHVTLYQNYHVMSVFNEGNDNSLAGNFEELRSYICAQLLWNPSMSREQYEGMIDEFMAGYYGDGWPYLRRMLDAVTERAQSDGHHFNIWDKPDRVLPFKYRGVDDTAFVDGMIALCDKALEAAQTEEQKAHVRKASVQAYYYRQYVNCRRKTDANTAMNQTLYERILEAGITRIGAWTDLPVVTDFTVGPDKW